MIGVLWLRLLPVAVAATIACAVVAVVDVPADADTGSSVTRAKKVSRTFESDGETLTVDERTVTVTVDKRAQSLESVPASVSAFEGEDLEAAGIQTGHIKQILHQMIEPLRRITNICQQRQVRCPICVRGRIGQNVSNAGNRGKRCAQLMRDRVEQRGM